MHLPFDEFLARLRAVETPERRQSLLSAWMARVERGSTPLLEKGVRAGFDRVIFLYRGPAKSVSLNGDFSDLVLDTAFQKISGTDLSYFSHEFESDARLDYKLVLDGGEQILDPLNPRLSEGVFGTNSQFWGSAYRVPIEIERHVEIPEGDLDEIVWASKILGNARAVLVYQPPPHGQMRARYPALYVHDGSDYHKVAGIAAIVNNLVYQRQIPPILVVLIPPVEREKEYDANADFARAIVEELVPLVEGNHTSEMSPEGRALLGASLGGLAAVHQGLLYPDHFRNVASQSGAFLKDAANQAVARSDCREVKFHLDVGTYEASYFGKNLVEGNRRVRDALLEKGCHVQYREVHEGHSWGSWRARIGEALKFFWGHADAGNFQARK